LVGLGIVTLGGVWLALPETAASRGIVGSGRMLGSYLSLLRSRSFLGYMFGGAFTSTSFYAYLMSWSFIFTQMLHRPATEIGLYYLAVMGGVPIGSFASSQLAPRVRLTLLLRATSALAVLGAAVFFAMAVSGVLNLATVLGPMILFSIGVGASGPVAITSAVSADPQMIGAASGLYGFTQMANARCAPWWSAYFRPTPPYPPPASCSPASSSADTSSFAPPEQGPARVHDPLLLRAVILASLRPFERPSAPWPGQL
jgi:MFS transporter, DHA1 family, multidrug resistance protein